MVADDGTGWEKQRKGQSQIPEVQQWLFLLIGVLVVDFLPKCVKNVNLILMNGIMGLGLCLDGDAGGL